MKLPVDPYFLFYYFDEYIVTSPYFKLIVISILAFVFVILLAMVRKHIFRISLRGATFGFAAGIILMILLDLIVLFGLSDKEKTERLFNKKDRQEAMTEVVSSGISNLTRVLGVSVTASSKKKYSKEDILEGLLYLPDDDTKKIRDLLCPQ